jgi:U3 small nucleolar RNA-associated protein 7
MEPLTVISKPSAAKKHDNVSKALRKAPKLELSQEEELRLRRRKEAEKIYGRGRRIDVRSVKDKKLKGKLQRLETKYQTAIAQAKDDEILHEDEPGFLEAENELEKTYHVKQREIQHEVASETARKRFDLSLEFGPYVCDFTRNGRELLLGGRKGHLASMNWRDGKLNFEIQLNETIWDARWLHNDQYLAVAQKKNVFIYDRQGVELHCLKQHREVTHMEFLPYHFLLGTLVCISSLFSCEV